MTVGLCTDGLPRSCKIPVAASVAEPLVGEHYLSALTERQFPSDYKSEQWQRDD